jgi:RNA polymerase sigma-70 factor (ECF subfamily)
VHVTVQSSRFRKELEARFYLDSGLFQSIAFNILRDAAAAEDACQQAFLQAMEKGGSLREPEKLRAWLCRTVTNCALQTVRKQKRLVVDGEYVEKHCSLNHHSHPRFSHRLILIEALGMLEEDTRVVVVMRILEEMSGNYVARTLGISPAEVSRRLHAGMEQLRHQLHDLEPEGTQ